MEYWKGIRDHPGYEISSLGRVRNTVTDYILKPYDDGDGYLRVKLHRVNCRVHLLVATAFIPNPGNKPVVNHMNGNKHDCRASQLEWATVAENTQHAWDNGLIRRCKKLAANGNH